MFLDFDGLRCFSQQNKTRQYTMATSDQIKTALLTEHFRYTPLVSTRLESRAATEH